MKELTIIKRFSLEIDNYIASQLISWSFYSRTEREDRKNRQKNKFHPLILREISRQSNLTRQSFYLLIFYQSKQHNIISRVNCKS